MSIFTNPPSHSAEQAEGYVHAVLALLGDRDPLQVLHDTPALLRKLVEDLSEEACSTPETTGKWSVRHVVRHLADSDLVWGVRLRMVLAQERPLLAGFDQDAWAHRLRYEEAHVQDAVEELTVLRRGNLRLLHRASEEDLGRIGIHSERGEESLKEMIPLYAGHDLVHLRQIERLRSVIGLT